MVQLIVTKQGTKKIIGSAGPDKGSNSNIGRGSRTSTRINKPQILQRRKVEVQETTLELVGVYDSKGQKIDELIKVSPDIYNLVRLASVSSYDPKKDQRRTSAWNGDRTSHAIRQRRGDLNERMVMFVLSLFDAEIINTNQFSVADDRFGVDIAIKQGNKAFLFQVKGSTAGVESASVKLNKQDINYVNTCFVRSSHKEGPKELLKVLMPLMLRAGFELKEKYKKVLEQKRVDKTIISFLNSARTDEELILGI